MNYLITCDGSEIYRSEARPTLRNGEQCFAIDPNESEQDLQVRIANGQTDTPSTSANELRDTLKVNRQAAVDAIKVTVSTGKVFDGNEISQNRMARAIIGLQVAGIQTIDWVLADNTVVSVTADELTEALVLSGQQQARLWVLDIQ